MESRKLVPGWKLDQDSRLRAQVAPGSQQEGAESWTSGLAAISTLVSAHKQEDQTAFGAGAMLIEAEWQQDFGKYFLMF